MDAARLIQSTLFFMVLWGFGILLLWFRPRLEPVWKLLATILFGLYVWFFWQDIVTGYEVLAQDWYGTVVTFITELFVLVFINLFFLWPLVLVIIFYKADDIGAEKLLKFMVLFTLALWVIFIIYHYFHQGIDDIIFNRLREFIPGAR